MAQVVGCLPLTQESCIVFPASGFRQTSPTAQAEATVPLQASSKSADRSMFSPSLLLSKKQKDSERKSLL